MFVRGQSKLLKSNVFLLLFVRPQLLWLSYAPLVVLPSSLSVRLSWLGFVFAFRSFVSLGLLVVDFVVVCFQSLGIAIATASQAQSRPANRSRSESFLCVRSF